MNAGIMSKFGDYPPFTPREVIDADRQRSVAVLRPVHLYARLALASGYGISGAKVLSLVALRVPGTHVGCHRWPVGLTMRAKSTAVSLAKLHEV